MQKEELFAAQAYPCEGVSYIEGTLEVPMGMGRIDNIMGIAADAEVLSASPSSNEINVSGKVCLQIAYINTDGQAESFDANCNYELSVPSKIPPEFASARVTVGQISYNASSDRVDIKAELISQAFSAKNSEFIPAELPEDFCTNSTEYSIPVITSVKQSSFTLRGNFAVLQSVPAVKKVLLATGCADIIRTHFDSGRAAIEGEIKLEVIYTAKDKAAPVQKLSEQLPFSQIISAEEGSLLSLSTSKVSVNIGADEDTLEYCIVIDVCTVSQRNRSETLVMSGYSTESTAEALTEKIFCTDIKEISPQKRIIRSGAKLPESEPEAARVLFSCVRPKISSAKCLKGAVNVEGELFADICCTTSEGLRTFSLCLPFTAELSAPVSEKSFSQISAECEYSVAEGCGRELELRTCLRFWGKAFCENEILYVSDISEGEALEREGGIIMYFAEPDETDWDIAKQFRIPQNKLKDMGEGRKIVII